MNIDLGNDPKIRRLDIAGAGIQDIFDNFEAKDLLEVMRSTDDDENAQFHVQTLVIADKGHTISGDDIADMMEESKRTGKPMAHLLKRLENAKTTVIVEPGPKIPETAKRDKHRGRNGKK